MIIKPTVGQLDEIVVFWMDILSIIITGKILLTVDGSTYGR